MNYSGGRVVMDGSNVVFHENPSRCGRIADHLWNMSKRRNFSRFPPRSLFHFPHASYGILRELKSFGLVLSHSVSLVNDRN